MKVLITGANGFVGKHLANELLEAEHEIVATGITEGTLLLADRPVAVSKLDICDLNDCKRVVDYYRPDAIVHLAGISQTHNFESDPQRLHDVNVTGAANVCIAASSQVECRVKSIIIVSSAFVYGGDQTSGTHYFSETSPTIPRGKYGHSKLAAEELCHLYDSEPLHVYRVRPFNHIGPGQDPAFAAPAFARKIARSAEGDCIETGNLGSRRDFTDVRDIARAYRLILEQRPSQRCFVLGSGVGLSMQFVFDSLVKISGKRVYAKPSPNLLRSGDTAELLANAALAKRVLNWTPIFSLQTTLKDLYESYASTCHE